MGANVLLLHLLLLFVSLLVDKSRSDGGESEEEEYPQYEGYEEDDWNFNRMIDLIDPLGSSYGSKNRYAGRGSSSSNNRPPPSDRQGQAPPGGGGGGGGKAKKSSPLTSPTVSTLSTAKPTTSIASTDKKTSPAAPAPPPPPPPAPPPPAPQPKKPKQDNKCSRVRVEDKTRHRSDNEATGEYFPKEGEEDAEGGRQVYAREGGGAMLLYFVPEFTLGWAIGTKRHRENKMSLYHSTNNTEEPHHGCWADLYGGNGVSVTCRDYEDSAKYPPPSSAKGLMCSELVAFNLRGNNEYLYTYRAEEKMVHGDRPVYSREGETEGTNGLTKKLERKIYLAYEGGIWTEYGNAGEEKSPVHESTASEPWMADQWGNHQDLGKKTPCFVCSKHIKEWPGGGGGIHLFGEAAAAIATMLQFPLFIIHKNFLE